ncbi:tyrosine-type recombinase/integrase [Clostridium celatum]|uniref:Site-specific recombinase, phage integrase family n=1 Tax=Clostridium celatum DSM 1785 TaxID=545697 RepID=L1QH46_9CLOT|nr:tyrosine-type recombinase/integrase [Clostridium celatum]EKY27010.1 site-specific recombinase, phage integrase family [Clostridium celatum DSM 1785]MCE9654731.1 tyrosine-type recombinase/integrase [Clostridium celatum]
MPKIIKRNNINVYIENFMEHCKLKGLSKKTMNSYEGTLRLFSKFLEEEYQIGNVVGVKHKHINEYLKFTKERGKYSYVSNDKTVALNNPANRQDLGKKISNITINNYIRNMKVFFNWCIVEGIIKKSPMDDIEFLKAKRKAKEDISDEDFMALIKVMDITKFHEYRDYVIVQLIMDTGMRLGETLSLEITDVHLEKRYIEIPAEITKGKKDRVVFFSNTMMTILRKWIQYKDRYTDDEIRVFCTKSGTKFEVRNFERNFRVYRERAGISKNITPHGLRNNFAKRFLMSGGDIYTLSRILGHSSVVVTEKAYLDLTVSDIRKNYKQFSPLENMNKR